MRKKILVRGPVLTQSGYGEHCRFLLRALKQNEDLFDIYLIAVNWGKTNWLFEDNEERRWIDNLIKKTVEYQANKRGGFDVSIQVTIPNEWERVAPVNIGVTAGIETTQIAPIWIQKGMQMDKIIVPSQHSKDVYVNTVYEAKDNKGEIIPNYRCTTPVEVVPYPVKNLEKANIDLELDYDFNFLAVAQWGPRKNLKRTIKWFIEEFKNEEVGLVIKTSLMKNCIFDREHMTNEIKKIVNSKKTPDMKCKIYLLHGFMKEEELNSLYTHSKIKALVSLTHGEGYGLPLFEAAYNGLPVIATNWSGHLDFLYAPVKDKKGKVKRKPLFKRITYELGDIPKGAIWDGVLQEGSKWAIPEKGSYKTGMRDVYKDYSRALSQAKKLRKHVLEQHEETKIYEKFITEIFGESALGAKDSEYIFVSDFFADQITGGAELSLETLIKNTDKSIFKINSVSLDSGFYERNKDKTWIFGNYTQLKNDVFELFVKGDAKYHVVEFDYKFCVYRSLELHEKLEGKECDCVDKEHGKDVESFLSSAQTVFFMSEKQKQIHNEKLKKLSEDKCVVLSSVFDDSFFEKIKNLRETYKDNKEDKWVISASPSWVKGAEEGEKWCVENEKEYVKLHGIDYDTALETLAKSKGLCFLPVGGDTCPRLVIEAKLLGCELEINDHVQHMKEDWFDTDNVVEIENYLKNVPTRFWDRVANG